MKPEKFSGSTSIETFLIQFGICSDYNRWDDADKAAQLKCSLSGSASQVLWDGTAAADMSYNELVGKLMARFGAVGLHERFAAELRSRRRRHNESLAELHADVKRLMALAYPDSAHSQLGQVIARDHFIPALGDREMELKVRDRDPEDLESAFRAAIRIETHLKAYEAEHEREAPRENRNRRDRFDDQRVRLVAPPADQNVNENESADSSVIKLFAQLERSQKERDELSKELGRLRLLAEQTRQTPLAAQPVVQTAAPTVAPTVDVKTGQGMGRGGRPQFARPRSPGACFSYGAKDHYARACPNRGAAPARRNEERPQNSAGVNTENGARTEGVQPAARGITAGVWNKPYLEVVMGSETVLCLLDTGADVSLIPTSKAGGAAVKPTSQKLFAVNGTEISVRGEVEIAASADGVPIRIAGLVSDHVTDVILGIGFLAEHKMLWDFASATVQIAGVSQQMYSKPLRNWCRRVVLADAVTLPPSSESVVSTKVVFEGGVGCVDHGEWATVINEPSPGVSVERTLIPPRTVDVPVRVANLNEAAVEWAAGTVVADLDQVEVYDDGTAQPTPGYSPEQLAILKSMVDGVDDSVTKDERDRLLSLLTEYASAFSLREDEIGHTTVTRHAIDTADALPVRQRLRRQPPAYQTVIKEHVDTILRQGIIEPARSAWAANVVLVKKKDGSYRCCVDYRNLNDITKKDAYTLPRTDMCLDALAGSVYFTTFDMKNSYHQVEVEPGDSDKTAFICREGMFKFKTMPFGLCNAGATFQRLVDMVLTGVSYEICLAYLDDVVLFSRTVAEHFDRLKIVLRRLQDAGLKLKPSKCFLLRKSVTFLGHLVSGDGVSAHPDKVSAVKGWPAPTCVRDVRGWLGLTGYYRRFVQNYAKIVTPLTALLSPKVRWVWTEVEQNAFETLKAALTNPPILAMPAAEGLFTLDTDASNTAIGAVLS
jgi:hypothetical protein